jgi:hypothetical protein
VAPSWMSKIASSAFAKTFFMMSVSPAAKASYGGDG